MEPAFTSGLLRRNHIVVDRLAARQQADFRLGTGRGKNILGTLCLLLAHILSVEDGDEFRLLVAVGAG